MLYSFSFSLVKFCYSFELSYFFLPVPLIVSDFKWIVSRGLFADL